MPLTNVQVKRAKSREKDWKLSDEKGLYLHVHRNGSKYWRLKYRFAGKEKLLALGVFGTSIDGVSLGEAREARDIARRQIRDGIDPSVVRKKEKLARLSDASNTFGYLASDWIKIRTPEWSERHALDVEASLDKDVLPYIGSIPISAIDTTVLRPVFDHVQERGAFEIAARLRQRCSAVFRHAMALGLCDQDPADLLKTVLITPKKANFSSLDLNQFPQFWREVQTYSGGRLTVLAMKLIALTFVRTSELIGGRWEEIDLDQKIWDIPPERMKKSRPHYVPLASQAIEALTELQRLTGESEWMFPKRGNPKARDTMSNGTILRCISRLGYRNRMTGHGFRSVASTALNESGKFNYDAIERQLAHEEENAVRAAYNKAKYMDERRRMMQWWADQLEQMILGG